MSESPVWRKTTLCASLALLCYPASSGMLAYMHPGVHVRCTAKIPHHSRSFDLPDIPYSVVANVLILVKGHVQILETVVFNQLNGFIRVLFTERRQQIGHHHLHMFLLIPAQFAN